MKPVVSWRIACELMLFAEKGQFSETCSDAMKAELRERALFVDGEITHIGKTLLARLVSGELAQLLDPSCTCGHTLNDHTPTTGWCIILGCKCQQFSEEQKDA